MDNIVPIANELLAELLKEKYLSEGMMEGVRELVRRLSAAQMKEDSNATKKEEVTNE